MTEPGTDHSPVPPTTPASPPSSRTRLDALDGLRTIAVFLVILFHVGTPWMAAGYIGVDMFFVLSGFLITAGLLRELDRSGRIDLARFWSRRIRRLMPAAMLVLAVVLVWTVFGADTYRHPGLGADVFFTSLYVANWHFIGSASYFSHDGTTSPLLHMWSLAVEEQFYLAWPLLMVALWWPLRRRSERLHRVVIGVAIAVLTVVSAVLLWVLYQPTASDRAYMGTDSKIFEPLLGAGLALALTVPAVKRFAARRGAVVATVALVALLPLFAVMDGPAPFYFRGGALLFSLAVAAVVMGLAEAPGGLVARALAWSPMAYLGRISYGLYLWHWPFAVWFSTHLGTFRPLRALAVVALSVAAAVVSYHLVEVPIREGRISRMLGTRRTFAAGLATILVPVLAASAIGGTPLSPLFDPLRSNESKANVVMVVGDSVPQRLMPALAPAGKAAGLDLVTATAGGCSPLGVLQKISPYDETGPTCLKVRDTQSQRLKESNAGVVLWWSRYEIADRYVGDTLLAPPSQAFWSAQLDDFRQAVQRLTANGATLVVVLTEPPGVGMSSRCSAKTCHPFLQRMVVHDDYRVTWNDLVKREAASNPRLRTITVDDVLCTTPAPGGDAYGSSLCDDHLPGGELIRPDGSHVNLPTAGSTVAEAVIGRLQAELNR
ncbi:acyltransferase family protein [Aestuariimicrobium soli]|uniref:acyltransferase family protein n=1 Tax=Aestuariimicrobium soli TaxID=2035834 RepID=UPI003EBD06CD